jgi:hypothetical protein
MGLRQSTKDAAKKKPTYMIELDEPVAHGIQRHLQLDLGGGSGRHLALWGGITGSSPAAVSGSFLHAAQRGGGLHPLHATRFSDII